MKDLEPVVYTRTAEGFDRCPIRFVVRSLEDERHVMSGGDFLQLGRHEKYMLAAFDDARAGDQKKIARQVYVKTRYIVKQDASLCRYRAALSVDASLAAAEAVV